MRRLLTFTVGLVLVSVNSWAAQKSVVPPTKGKAKMMANLLKRCEDGVALACFDYGVILRKNKDQASKRKAARYIRRACTLAYAPACQTRSTVAESKPMKDTKPKVDANGKPCNAEELAKSVKLGGEGRQVAEVSKGSLWEQAGVQAGDKVLSVNGTPYTGPDQVGQALEKGGVVLNVDRGGRETSVMLECP